jgi:hypothetical protein
MGAIALRIGLFLQLAFLIEDEVIAWRARRDRAEPGVVGDVAPTP